MTGAVLSAFRSHWMRHPLQLITLLAGIALATGLWSAVQAINAEARASYAEAAEQIGAGAGLDELAAPSGTMPLATYVRLRRAGWKLAPVLEGRARLGDTWVTLTGIDPLSHPALPVFTEVTEGGATGYSYPDIVGSLFANPRTATTSASAPGLPPVITSAQVPPGVVLGDIGLIERLLDRPGRISRLLVLPDQSPGLAPLDQLAPELTRTSPDRAADTTRLTRSFHLNLTAFGLLSFAVGLFIVHGTVGLAFEQRRPMFRTLRALGLPLRRLSVLLAVELLTLSLAAGAAGLVLGWLVAAALLPDVAATLRGLYGAPVTGGLSLRPGWVFSGLGMALAGTGLAGSHALWRLRDMPLLASPGLRAWSRRGLRSAGRQAQLGAALAAAGVGAVLAWDGLIAGFALLAGVLLGAALILPLALDFLLRLGAARARNVVAEWLWADMRIQLPGLSLALMALLLALAANIGVGTMVKSFRATFTGWLDQRLAAELYVTTTSDAQAAQLRAWLEDKTDAVLPIRYTTTTVEGDTVRVYGVIDHATYRDNWPVLQGEPDLWDQVMDGKAALINEQLARKHGVWTGGRIRFGPDHVMRVAGVYSDYGNPEGQAIVSMPNLLALDPTAPDRQFGLRVAPGQADGLAAALLAFDPPLAGVLNQSDVKARSLEIFEKTFLVTAALNVLTLGVAGFAILTSLLTLWTVRLPQVAPVWALGLTRARLARLELWRSVILSGLTAVLAIPLGLGLAWVLLTVINVEAFGWRLPMHIYPGDWLGLTLLALIAGLAAAALPSRRLARIRPAELLKVFANER